MRDIPEKKEPHWKKCMLKLKTEHGIDRIHAEEYIKKMKQRGDLLSPDQNHIRLVN